MENLFYLNKFVEKRNKVVILANKPKKDGNENNKRAIELFLRI